ncbi:MAG: 2-dehydropantoate 2-reductase [Burkholderiales bacterium]|nr:2-dehydropantoate 2-reductase [Burkholderiales bacterium]
MRICVYGAGAIGGTIAARLALAGHAVSVVARGAHLAAIRAHGLRLAHGGSEQAVAVTASERGADLGTQDVVIIALKSHSLPAAAADVAALVGPQTAVVTAMNGVPWWFFDGWGGALAGTALAACDPDGRIARAIAPAHVVGGVVFLAANVPQPGLVQHDSGNRLILGEPAHRASARVDALVAALAGAGFDAVASAAIRREIWLKLLGNVCFNPVSVLTGVATDRMIADRHLASMFGAMMREAMALADALGLDARIDPEARMAQSLKLGSIKSSMLQDVEAGRPIELDAIVGSVVEIAERVGVATPFINAVFGAVRVRAAMLGLYPGR